MPKKNQSQSMEAMVRALVRRNRAATLATSFSGRREGWPYASLVSVACACDASPVLLLSTLADHTRNLALDARASLLFEEASHLANPQTGPRVTLTGKLTPTRDPLLGRRFLARHPAAELYAGFGDFGFYKMKVERAHFVGGFAQAKWIAAKKFLIEGKAARSVASAEEKLLRRLNANDAKIISQITGKQWFACGTDPDGVDLIQKNKFSRLEFDQPVRSGRGVQAKLTKIAKK